MVNEKDFLLAQGIRNKRNELLKTKNGKSIYTHLDKEGMPWRFEGNRPISMLADEVMKEIGL